MDSGITITVVAEEMGKAYLQATKIFLRSASSRGEKDHVLFPLWQQMIARIFERLGGDKREFLSLSAEVQKAQFPPSHPLNYERFEEGYRLGEQRALVHLFSSRLQEAYA